SNSSIAENQSSGTTVGTLSDTDPDVGDTATFTLVSGTGSDDNASFTVSGTDLQTAASFDYETKNSYTVRVRATDFGGLYYEKQFTINVNNVNEAPAGADNTVTTSQDVPYTFSAEAFGFADANDNPANNLLAVKITTLPSSGTLTFNG